MAKVISFNKRRAAKAATQPEAPAPTTALAVVEKTSAVPKAEPERTPEQLVPLIKTELAKGREHYVAAGRLLLEAKEKVPHGKFISWIAENFELSYETAKLYMRAVNQTGNALPVSTLREVRADSSTRRINRKVVTLKVKAAPAPKPKIDWAEDARLTMDSALDTVARQKIKLLVKNISPNDVKQLLEKIAAAEKHLAAVKQALRK